MKRRYIAISLLSLATGVCLAGEMINTAADLQRFSRSCMEQPLTPFVVTGRINAVFGPDKPFIIEDETGRAYIYGQPSPSVPRPRAGTRAIISGKTFVQRKDKRFSPWAYIHRCETLGSATPPEHAPKRIRELDPVDDNCRRVKVAGRVTELKPDEIDDKAFFFFLRGEGAVIAVSAGRDRPELRKIVPGCKLEIHGTYFSSIDGLRPFTPPCIIVSDGDEMNFLTDEESVPPLENLQYSTPDELARLDLRRTEGVVLASWQPDQFLLRTDDGTLVKVHHRKQSRHPLVGETVSVIGFPETDLYSIVLTCADINAPTKPAPPRPAVTEIPAEITPRQILFSRSDIPMFSVRDQLGSLVRLKGTVVDIQRRQDRTILLVEQDGASLPVDISDNVEILDRVAAGYKIEATGVCVLEGEMWTPMNAMPQLRSYTVVLRSPADLVVLARPSWWTPARLLYIIGGLLTVLLGFLVWIRMLDRLVRKRSAALLAERRAGLEATLKIDERTRLAAELHDSLSQNLSALAFQVSAAKSTAADGTETHSLLSTAERMLQSSRTELTRCLWDLRGDALEESDFTRAIENTLARLALKAKTSVRFNVPRSRVDDTTAHAVLCIVRELVTNAVRHGHAGEIRVAGETHDDTISFSVRDDGIGFDAASAPGVAEGHFGLEGVRDRVNRLGGDFVIDSKPGAGVKATVTLKMKRESTGNEYSV